MAGASATRAVHAAGARGATGSAGARELSSTPSPQRDRDGKTHPQRSSTDQSAGIMVRVAYGLVAAFVAVGATACVLRSLLCLALASLLAILAWIAGYRAIASTGAVQPEHLRAVTSGAVAFLAVTPIAPLLLFPRLGGPLLLRDTLRPIGTGIGDPGHTYTGYDPVRLQGSGRPLGLLMLRVAALQPLLMVCGVLG